MKKDVSQITASEHSAAISSFKIIYDDFCGSLRDYVGYTLLVLIFRCSKFAGLWIWRQLLRKPHKKLTCDLWNFHTKHLTLHAMCGKLHMNVFSYRAHHDCVCLNFSVFEKVVPNYASCTQCISHCNSSGICWYFMYNV